MKRDSRPAGPLRPRRAERSHAPKALYLMGIDAIHVTCTGESLVITTPGGGSQRVPLNRIMRVVCNASTQWSGTALATCLERGIPMSWIDGGGGPLGQLWPIRQHGSPMSELLDALASDDPDWPQVYSNWLRRERLLVLKGWAERRREAGCEVHLVEWQQALQAWVYRAEVHPVLPPVLHGMATAFVASQLVEHALPERWVGVYGEDMPLANDVTKLVWAGMNLDAGPLAAAIDRPAEAAAVFERWAPACASAMHQHLSRLHGLARRRFRA